MLVYFQSHSSGLMVNCSSDLIVTMKIAVIGPGALGALFAAYLSRTVGNEIFLLDHYRQRAAEMNNRILLVDDGREFSCPLTITADAEVIGPADLIFLCVKSADVAGALSGARPLFFSESLLVPLENGISHLDILSPCDMAIGVTAQGATLLEPGRVRHGGNGLTRIGFRQTPSPKAEKKLNKVVNVLNSVGFITEITTEIDSYIWNKLLVNVGINALTAIYDCPNGKLLEEPARSRMLAAVREGELVAEARGIRLPHDPQETTLQVCRDTADNISSMLQDVRRSRSTEINAINGALLVEADRFNIPMPVNRQLVRELEHTLKLRSVPERLSKNALFP